LMRRRAPTPKTLADHTMWTCVTHPRPQFYYINHRLFCMPLQLYNNATKVLLKKVKFHYMSPFFPLLLSTKIAQVSL
jgi:hypothetical protein